MAININAARQQANAMGGSAAFQKSMTQALDKIEQAMNNNKTSTADHVTITVVKEVTAALQKFGFTVRSDKHEQNIIITW
jgi:hypothetical protein